MRARPKLKHKEVVGAFYYYLVFLRLYSYEEADQTMRACEQWQIEEIAYKGLARRKRLPDAWRQLTGY